MSNLSDAARRTVGSLALVCAMFVGHAVAGEGLDDGEVRIAGSYPFSGPLSAYGQLGSGAAAYFAYINDTQGGVAFADGKKRLVNFISEDDGFQPARALANAQKFVGQDDVFAVISNVGSAQAIAMRELLNEEKIPQVFVYASPNTFSDDHDEFPMTGPTFMLPDTTEAAMFAEYLKVVKPEAKVAALNLNNLGGRDFVRAFEQSIAGSKITIVDRQSYEPTATTVDAEVAALARSGADVLIQYTAGKTSSQAIRKVAELGWKPMHYVIANASQLESALKPAGLENAEGLYTQKYFMDPSDPANADNPEIKLYKEAIEKYGNGVEPNEDLVFHGFALADLVVKAMEKSQPTRESFLETVWSMQGRIFGTLPGVTLQMGGGDNYPNESAVPMQFRGGHWVAIGDAISYEGKSHGFE